MNDFLKSIFEPLTEILGAGLQTFLDWGASPWLAIVLLTVVVRALLFPLTIKQARSARRLRELRPDLEELRARHEDSPGEQREAMMKLYAERRVNPLGGCLPALIQLPIFLALYFTIGGLEVPGLETGGLLWFRNLTLPDPYQALPALYALTMSVAQEPALQHTAPQQKRLMRLLPPVFGLFLAVGSFPAGLFVYWISSNLITLLQNLFIYREAKTSPEGPYPQA